MRNNEYKDDQSVYRFVNSAQCKSLGCLYDFLKENNLPVRERWVFYLLGKSGYLDEWSISSMSDKDSFGGYFDGKVYFWSIYLKNEEEKKTEIRNEILTRNKECRIRIKELEEEIDKLEHQIEILDNYTKERQFNSISDEGLLINKILILDELKSEYEKLKSIDIDEESIKLEIRKRFIDEGYNFARIYCENHSNMLESIANYNYRNEVISDTNFRSNFCEACQESPCRCSDPDPN